MRPSTETVQAAGLSELNGKEPLRLIPMERLQGNYSESYCYDQNCNLTWLQRTGTSNSITGQVIDLLECSYSGNQLKNVTDYSDEELNYASAFDFYDKADEEQEYSYDENGAMTKDLNKGITNIEYDLLGNPLKVMFSDRSFIDYVYSADGRKLRTVHSTAFKVLIHRPGPGMMKGYRYEFFRDTTDYINNYVFKNGKPEMFCFPGGYYSFDKDGNMDGCHLYVQDYQGNNRMVVNAYTDEVEQVNHYYPYGVLMADISTNHNEQNYKYGGKELDRKYGLDLYDFEARQQDPLIGGRFTSVDPMAGDYNWLSPYAYCGGDPINYIDPTGMNQYFLHSDGHISLALKTDDDYDELYATDARGNYTKDKSIKVKDRCVLPELSVQGITDSYCNLIDLFFFLHDNVSSIEWGIVKFNDGMQLLIRGSGQYFEEEGSVPGLEILCGLAGKNISDAYIDIHSHIKHFWPSGNYGPDGMYNTELKNTNGYEHYDTRTKTDQSSYEYLQKKYGAKSMPLFAVSYKGKITFYTWKKVYPSMSRSQCKSNFFK